ncbi:MAG: HAD-IC family P-type ATPase [Patescibacteria group bacterium]
MPPKTEKLWHALEIKQCFKFLKTSEHGLTTKEALERQKIYKKNELPPETSLSWAIILLNQLKSPMVYILLAAGVISLLLSHFTDAGVIFFAVLINTSFGFWQENKADRAISHLKKMVRQQARVKRDGRIIELDSTELVRGDVILLKAGDKVPADARVILAENLALVEASLTGEADPSSKTDQLLDKGTILGDRENMVYMGTITARGRGQAVVCATGINTEIGKITKLIKETKEEKTPLQKQLSGFTRALTIGIGILCVFIFIIGIINRREPIEIFVTAVALAVAAIPEGLIVAITIILTIGMQFILKRQALVRKLLAAETLGSVSIICTDKTGTLTEGKMQVSKIITAEREYLVLQKNREAKLEKIHDLISKTFVLCSSAVIENPDAGLEELKIIGDPTEKALLVAAIESGLDKKKLDQEYLKLAEIPFDSEKKYMATLHQHRDENRQYIFAKGAPEKILQFCGQILVDDGEKTLDKKQLDYLKNKYEKLTQKGLRLLALAYKTDKSFSGLETALKDLVFLGFVALKDPLRPEAREAMRLCHQAGIRPIIVTGDHRLTARAIFEELGIKNNHKVVDGEDLDRWSDKELIKNIKEIDIYARVEPRHKLRIVNAWQAKGEVVAMTGDGVNDAPALKAADIGISLGDGTDVTKETADIILLDNNFKVIVAAVEQGRIIFDNIRKVILYLLCDSFSEIILVSASLLLGLPMPILATQILWINLINDGLPNIAMTMEKGEPGVMQEAPLNRKEPILNREMKIIIFVIGIITDLMLLGLFLILLKLSFDLDYIRTVIFVALGCDSLLYAFSVRSLRHSIFTQNPFKNKFLLGAIFVSFATLLLVVYLPWLQRIFHTVALGYWEWLVVIVLALVGILMIEGVKHYFILKKDVKKIKYA